MKKTKRLLAVVLSVIMAISCFAVVPVMAEDLSTLPTYDGVTGVTLVNQKLNSNYDKLTENNNFANLADRIEVSVPEKYGSATDNTLQMSDMDTAFLTEKIGTKSNLMNTTNTKYQFYSQREGEAWNQPSGDALTGMFDGVIKDSANPNTIGWTNSNAGGLVNNGYVSAVDEANYKYGSERVAEGKYDMRFKTDMGGTYILDNFYMFSEVRYDYAPITYKVFVSDSETDLYEKENEVFYFDAHNIPQTFGNSVSFNSAYTNDLATTKDLRSEGQFLTFGGETKPTGRYIGIIVYDASWHTNQMLAYYEIGALGTLDFKLIQPTDAASNGRVDWSRKSGWLSVGSDYKGVTVQVDDIYESALSTFGTNKITNVEIKDSSGATKAVTLADVTDGKIYDNGVNGSNFSAAGLTFPTRPATTTAGVGAARLADGTYDATITLTLKNKTIIDTLYNFAHPGTNLAWCTYEVYVGNDEANLYNDENRVAYFDYYDGYRQGASTSLNGTNTAVSSDATARRSEGQVWKFTGEKPVGSYVGYKLYYAETSTSGRIDIYDLGVFGADQITHLDTTSATGTKTYDEKLAKTTIDLANEYTANIQLSNMVGSALGAKVASDTNAIKALKIKQYTEKDYTNVVGDTFTKLTDMKYYSYDDNGNAGTSWGSDSVLPKGYEKNYNAEGVADTAIRYSADRVAKDRYDYLLTADLGTKTKLEKFMLVGGPNQLASYCTYAVYVSNDEATLYDAGNQVFFFDAFNGYSLDGSYRFNGKHGSSVATDRGSEAQYLEFTGDNLPEGRYVGIKMYDAYTNTNGAGRAYLYDVFVSGDAHVHTEETIPGKEATCTEAGLTEGVKCSDCGEILTAQVEIPAEGHTWNIDEEYTARHCTVCSAVTVVFVDKVNNPVYEAIVASGSFISDEDLAAAEAALPTVYGYKFSKWDDDLTTEIIAETTLMATYKKIDDGSFTYNVTIDYIKEGEEPYSAQLPFDTKVIGTDLIADYWTLGGEVFATGTSFTAYVAGDMDFVACRGEVTEPNVTVVNGVAVEKTDSNSYVTFAHVNTAGKTIQEIGFIYTTWTTYDAVTEGGQYEDKFTMDDITAAGRKYDKGTPDVVGADFMIEYYGIQNEAETMRYARAYVIFEGDENVYYSNNIISQLFNEGKVAQQ